MAGMHSHERGAIRDEVRWHLRQNRIERVSYAMPRLLEFNSFGHSACRRVQPKTKTKKLTISSFRKMHHGLLYAKPHASYWGHKTNKT